MKKQLTAHSIAIMGLLIALQIVLSRIIAIETPFLKINAGFIPMIILGALFGPFWAGTANVLADFVGMTLFARAPFFWGFSFNAFVEGAIYGFFFYKKEMTLKRAILATTTITLLISLCLTPLWLALMYKVPLFDWAIWGPRLIKTIVGFPIRVGLTYLVGKNIPYQEMTKKSLFKA
ncbi:ECF transporter S component (folate family) [Enterococcus sp. PF1-24]|uniref:folate family ECF transporter S component n=1 Tax=unclassified Enterococcus TaxID=2608891 RepID=UPI00247604A5|nr:MULTISPECIES: folate family ECF transporter S component [unclassified Enterococcus]MDH6365350.1 ECF transporter S component (folate family) [Enterococcus sp. PFB1-1]MDH6402451.1 ECF transporter S component (folate family) [Enterococcus sp. PF1-24]